VVTVFRVEEAVTGQLPEVKELQKFLFASLEKAVVISKTADELIEVPEVPVTDK